MRSICTSIIRHMVPGRFLRSRGTSERQIVTIRNGFVGYRGVHEETAMDGFEEARETLKNPDRRIEVDCQALIEQSRDPVAGSITPHLLSPAVVRSISRGSQNGAHSSEPLTIEGKKNTRRLVNKPCEIRMRRLCACARATGTRKGRHICNCFLNKEESGTAPAALSPLLFFITFGRFYLLYFINFFAFRKHEVSKNTKKIRRN